MIKKPITINLSTGLEARPVAQMVQVASQFNSEIYVEIGQKRVNAKSIMGMMTLGLDAGEEIVLSANGDDEEAAMQSIEKYLSNQYLGIDYDINEKIYNALPSLTLQSIVDFEKQNMAKKPYRYIILGNEKELDIKSLEKIGKIKRLSTEEIFGY